MTPEEIRQNMQLEMDAGNEALEASRSLVKQALLYTAGLEPKSHEDLEHLFGLHFVKTGRVDVKYAKLLARLQKYREQSDYGLVSFFSQEDLEQELAEVDSFLQSIQDYLKI